MKKLIIVVLSLVIFALGGYFGAWIFAKIIVRSLEKDREDRNLRRSGRSRINYRGYVPRSREGAN